MDAARHMAMALLAERAPDATICPSEVARAIGNKTDWRDWMAAVHAAIDQLLDDGCIRPSWKGRMLPVRIGPYRIARSPTAAK
ncbi:DUF3253 domain-containing protein [Sphingobium sufflavum]|uniref:DUF3253 domain-containing protein n=1 Tax=Sphingobium sufflavum TaxID=1129547 RepID=UPI001F1BE244|nr:DUF3253 domain-containing protein [Sphingobium sufflavum]MCE7798153.1 DUF3253 domain-containing protein [Sphingobium sufflavum]